MNTIKRRAALPAALLLCLALTACNPINWVLGHSFGVDVSVTQPHIDTVINRAPVTALYNVGCPNGACNEKAIQDLIWHFGAPPVYSVCDAPWTCVDVATVRTHMYYWIYQLNVGPNWSQVVSAGHVFGECVMIRWIPTVESVRGITTNHNEGCIEGSLK